MLSYKENVINYTTAGDLSLHYCGMREKSLNHRYGPHRFDTYILYYIMDGSAVFYINGERRTLSSGQFYAVFPHSEIRYVTETGVPWSIQWIVVSGEQVRVFLDSIGICEQQPVMNVKQRDKLHQIFESLFQYSNRKTSADHLRCLSLVYPLGKQSVYFASYRVFFGTFYRAYFYHGFCQRKTGTQQQLFFQTVQIGNRCYAASLYPATSPGKSTRSVDPQYALH